VPVKQNIHFKKCLERRERRQEKLFPTRTLGKVWAEGDPLCSAWSLFSSVHEQQCVQLGDLWLGPLSLGTECMLPLMLTLNTGWQVSIAYFI